MSISLQNTIFVILTIIIILTTFALTVIKNIYKRFLNISSNFESLKDLITFINHISRRNKFKRLKHYYYYFFIN